MVGSLVTWPAVGLMLVVRSVALKFRLASWMNMDNKMVEMSSAAMMDYITTGFMW